MKRKMSIILNIATLCICLCAIAIGVYSAKYASLNITGAVGFTAHNCKVDVTANVTGVATEDMGEKTTITKSVSLDASSSTTKTGTIPLWQMYFTETGTVNEQPAPIKIVFTIKNKSSFTIKADVTLPTCDNVDIWANKTSMKIDAGSETSPTEETIIVNFKLQDPETGITDLNLTANNFNISFDQFLFKKSDIVVKKETDTGIYYIEYGTNVANTSVTLPWYIMGKEDSSGQLTALETSDIVANGDNYKMKDDVTYALFSKYVLDKVAFSTDITYNYDDEWISSEWCKLYANNYTISNIRSYLNGIIVTGTNNSQINYFTINTLKGTSETNNIYTLIKPRTLSSMCTYLEYHDPVLDTTNTEGISGTDADAFWLISEKEWIDVIGSGNNVTSVDGVSASTWWLRSWSTIMNYSCVKGIYDGYSTYLTISYVSGVRPAFLI